MCCSPFRHISEDSVRLVIAVNVKENRMASNRINTQIWRGEGSRGMLFTRATKHGGAGNIRDLHPAVLQPSCNKKGMPNLPLEWERHICRPIDFWGLKGS